MNRDEAEAHIAVGWTVEESAKRVWHSLVGTFEDVRVMRISSNNFDQIRFGLEWKDTFVVMDTASESICPNNAMQLNTLICKERSAEYDDFGSGVLEARNIGVLLVKILFVDCLPGLLMNLYLYLESQSKHHASWITKKLKSNLRCARQANISWCLLCPATFTYATWWL